MIGVLAPGALTLIEDGGRRGHMRCGVSRAGAMDRTALFHANMLVGNGETEGALEATLTTPELCFGDDALFAVTGGRCAPLLDGERVPMDTAVRARPGQTLSSSPVAPGCRAYFAFAGGLGLHGALGSVSCDKKAGIGGLGRGEALRRGDVLQNVMPRVSAALEGRKLPERASAYIADGAGVRALRVTDGPQAAALCARGRETLFSGIYTVAPESDRMGIRFTGTKLPTDGTAYAAMITDAVCPGAIQLPPSGLPILMMADAQTTGGYPKPMFLISADMDRAAQLRPGDKARFVYCTPDEAREALLLMRRERERVRAAFAPRRMRVYAAGQTYEISVTEVFPY